MRARDLLEALAVARSWHARHGRPATWWEWEYAEPGRPTARTISRRWGWHPFWARAIAADPDWLYPAGDVANPDGQRRLRQWSSQEMLDALRTAHRVEGRWPKAGEWESPTSDHPSRRTYVRRFGSWAAAIIAAGGSVDGDGP